MESTSLYIVLGRAMVRAMEGVRRRLHRRLSGRRRLDLAALIGSIQQRRELAALLLWPAFILVQMGGIGFNLGVLGATLSKVVFSDMAFAWQSTLQLSPELVAELVRWIALPWSWIVPQAYPSLEQIQGSQMVLKEGVAHLATANLVAWWPFPLLLRRCLRPAAPLPAAACRLAQTASVPGAAGFRYAQLSATAAADDLAPHRHQGGAGTRAGEPCATRTCIHRQQAESRNRWLSNRLPWSGRRLVMLGNRPWVLIPEEIYEECPLADLSAPLAEIVPGLTVTPTCL